MNCASGFRPAIRAIKACSMGRLFRERGDFKFLQESFCPFYDQHKKRVGCLGQGKEENPLPVHRYITNRLPCENKNPVFFKDDSIECCHELRCSKNSAPPDVGIFPALRQAMGNALVVSVQTIKSVNEPKAVRPLFRI